MPGGWLVNASGRIGTGFYSDTIGRANAYLVNGIVSAACLFAMPAIMQSGSIVLLFLAVGIAYWQYGGGLSLMHAMADEVEKSDIPSAGATLDKWWNGISNGKQIWAS